MTEHQNLRNTACDSRLLFQVLVEEGEVFLPPLRPASLEVEIEVNALFVFIRNGRRFVCSLEPRQILLVEPPRLFFQFLRCKILHVGPLTVIEDVEKRVDVELCEQLCIE